MIYEWDIDVWVAQETPEEVRCDETVKWNRVLLKPLKTLYAQFLTYRTATLKKMAYNGQTIILENLLNNLFDNALRRIKITTIYDIEQPVYIFQQSEDEPFYLYTQAEYDADPTLQQPYLYQQGEFGFSFDFIVEAAAGSLTAEQIIQLKATVERYRIRGKIPFYRYDNLQPF